MQLKLSYSLKCKTGDPNQFI